MAMLLNGRPYADDDALPRRANPGRHASARGDFSRSRRHGDGDGDGGMGRGMMGGMGGGMMDGMMSMAHPIHLHGQQFQI